MIEYAISVTPTSELEFNVYWTTIVILVIFAALWMVGCYIIKGKGAKITLHCIMLLYVGVLFIMSYNKYSDLQYRQVTRVEATLIPGELVGTVQCGKSLCNQVYVRYATAEGPVTLAKALGQVYPEKATLYRIYTK